MKSIIKILCSSLSVYILVVFVGAYLTLQCQADVSHANIVDYGDALWWCLNATSVGDSDVYPVTMLGRIIGAFLIVIGYGLFTINVGVISAGLMHLLKPGQKEK